LAEPAAAMAELEESNAPTDCNSAQ
jgi:hypothetical protein